MTDKEKAIVMAHTGICMLAGDKFHIFHKYVEDIMGRPILTHEIGWLADTIKEKAKADFLALCADESSSEKPNKWIPVSERLPEKDGDYLLFGKVVEDDTEDTFIGMYDACAEKFGYWESYYDKDTLGFLDSELIEYNKVTAWMPLPESYKAESEDS